MTHDAPLKTNMTLENLHVLSEIHLQMSDVPLSCWFSGGGATHDDFPFPPLKASNNHSATRPVTLGRIRSHQWTLTLQTGAAGASLCCHHQSLGTVSLLGKNLNLFIQKIS